VAVVFDDELVGTSRRSRTTGERVTAVVTPSGGWRELHRAE
jgi:hypothetical protein